MAFKLTKTRFKCADGQSKLFAGPYQQCQCEIHGAAGLAMEPRPGVRGNNTEGVQAPQVHAAAGVQLRVGPRLMMITLVASYNAVQVYRRGSDM